MIYQIFILLMIFDIVLIWYSFTHNDVGYYTDIVTSLVALIFTTILAYICLAGIEFNSALGASVQYDLYRSSPLAILLSAVSLTMLIFFIVKILELTHTELEQL